MLLDFIKGNELDSHIRYLGKTIAKCFGKECYQAADVFVLFSNKENMPCDSRIPLLRYPAIALTLEESGGCALWEWNFD